MFRVPFAGYQASSTSLIRYPGARRTPERPSRRPAETEFSADRPLCGAGLAGGSACRGTIGSPEGFQQAGIECLGQGYFPQVQYVQLGYGLPVRPSVGTCVKAHPANVRRPSDPAILVLDVTVELRLKPKFSHASHINAPDKNLNEP
jgi:hypothetical protein